MKRIISLLVIGVFLLIILFNFEVKKVNYYITLKCDVVMNSETELRVKGLPQNYQGMQAEYFVTKNNDTIFNKNFI